MVRKHKDNLFEIVIPNRIAILTGKAGMEELEIAIKNKFETMENVRIEIELISMKHQKVLQGKAFIELRDKTLRYKAFLLSEKAKDKEDPSLGTEEGEDEWDCFLRKDQIVAVDIALGTPDDFDKHWNITVSCSGRYNDLDFYFKFEDKSKAIKFQQTILTWVFGEKY